MKSTLLTLLLLVALPLFGQTTRNDDSCDVTTLPAATLLLPYFEVDMVRPVQSAHTTLVTIVNTTATPQIANVTFWTDWAYPVLTFDLFLTGYDVQAINLRDVIASGAIAPTSSNAPRGSRSGASNPNFLPSAQTACANIPGLIPPRVLAEVQQVLTTGRSGACGSERLGANHESFASGYVTFDVVATCSGELQTNAQYWDELLYDNVLTGDWMIISPDVASGNYAAAEPLVHIRAVPEGGNTFQNVSTNLPYTFYDRLLRQQRLRDRRQPLPSTYAARYIQGGGTGFATNFLMWREGVTSADASCGLYAQNSRMEARDIVRFDERENPTVTAFTSPVFPSPAPTFSAASRAASTDTRFPLLTSGDVAGWMYLSLDNFGSIHYSTAPGRNFVVSGRHPQLNRQSQNWVVPMMFAEGRYSASFTATALANGCSTAPPPMSLAGTDISIRPGANVTP